MNVLIRLGYIWNWLGSSLKGIRVFWRVLSRVHSGIWLLALAAAGVAALILVPPQIAPPLPDPQAHFEVLDRARLTVALVFGGIVGIIGVSVNWRRASALERQVATAQLGQITERFTRAIDQLGAVGPDNAAAPEIRAGGVRSLERIARESEGDYWSILDILSAYLRSQSAAPPADIDGYDLERFEERAYGIRNRMDVAFAIDAIGRLWPHDQERVLTALNLAGVFAPRIALPATNLRGADLGSAYLERADLEDANLRNASLRSAYLASANLTAAELEGADLSGAELRQAKLIGASLRTAELLGTRLADADLRAADLRCADLRSARLWDADLCDADLRGADLKGADLRRANLEGADLRGTDLRSADLRDTSLFGTTHDESTQWPEGFAPPP